VGGLTLKVFIMKNLKDKLKNAEKILVLGVGSELRGDDIAGIVIAGKIEKNKAVKNNPKVKVIYGYTAPENFTGEIKKFNPSHIILVDCADMGKSFGDVEIIEKEKILSTAFSTHSLPIKIMIDYIKESINAETIVIGIQPENIKFGEKVSDSAKKAISKVSREIVKILKTP